MYYFWLFWSITWPWVAFIFNSIVLLGFKYIKGLTEILSKNILVYESWPFKLEVSLVWSLARRGRGRKTKREKGWQRRTTMERFSTLFFVTVWLQKQTVSIPIHCGLKQSCFTTEEPELSWNNKCDNLVQSIWVKWQKRSTGNNQRCSIKTLHQTPKTITKHFFFLHPIYFYAPSEYRGWLCNNVNKMIFFILFFSFSIFREHKRIMSHSVHVCPIRGYRTVCQYVSTCACTVSRCNSVCALVYTSQNTHIYHRVLHLHLCSTCLNMKDFTGTLILVSAHFLLYLFSCKAAKKKKTKKTHWRTTVGFILRNSFPHIVASFLGIPLRK